MNPSSPKPRRRWLQIGLKSMLVLMTIAAGYFAGVGTMIRREQKLKQEAISAAQAARNAEAQARLQVERQRLLAESAVNSLKAAQGSSNQPMSAEEGSGARPD